MENQINYLSWDDITEIVKELAIDIHKEYQPEIIIAVARGGMIPGVMLSHALNIRDVETIVAKETINDEIHATKVELKIEENKNLKKITGKRVLVVDDILGSGATITKIQNVVLKWNPKEIKSAVCMVNKDNWEKKHQEDYKKTVDYVGKETRGWVVFPWE